MSSVLIFGASGYVGTHLVSRLAASGHQVRAASRRPEILEGRGWSGVEKCQADALTPATLHAALDGVKVAYYLVHSMAAGPGYPARDRQAAENFAAAAEGAGLRRIIFLGGLQPPNGPSQHLASRMETGDRLRAGRVPVTELRAGIIVGAGSAAFEVIRDLVNHLPVMITPRWVRSRTQPIALEDLLDYLERVLEIDDSDDHIFDVAGPEVLRYQELIQQTASILGKRCRVVPVPVLSPRLSSYWLDLVTAAPSNVVRPLIDSLSTDLLADDLPIRRRFPIPLHSFADAVRDALAAEEAAPLPARWAEGSLVFRGSNPENSFYSKGERIVRDASASADAVWAEVRQIGGKRGYGCCGALWRLRGLLDRLVGGAGMRRGRRDPYDLRVGDAIDFWRVVAVEAGRRLTLVAEMRLPGSAVLEFEVEPVSADTSRLIMNARFHPAGLPGLVYWYALTPAHGRIFGRMPEAFVRAAEQRAGHSGTPAEPDDTQRRAPVEAEGRPTSWWRTVMNAIREPPTQ